MDAIAILNLIGTVIKTAVDLTPSVIKTVEDAEPFAKLIWDHLVNKKVITQADLDALNMQTSDLSKRIQAAIPPEQDDDV